MLLQRQPNQKAAELAGKLNISVRSLHRYIARLEEMGIPIYTERGPYGGFSLVRGYKMPPLVFSPEEAVAIYLGTSLVEEMWGRLYLEAAQAALAKLDAVLPDDQRQEVAWARRSLVTTGLHRAAFDAQVSTLESLRQAIRQQQRVCMSYRGISQLKPTVREVDPYALVHRWGWWYVAGYCHLRRALRSFRVDRIYSLELLSETFQPPLDFDVRQYLASESQPPPHLQVKLHFSAEGAFVAHNQPIQWDNLEELPDGSVIVSFSAYDLDYAAQMAMSFGLLVEVMEPAELRTKVVEYAREILDKYT
jgi:predicted DNA-binding transcriptional regulator YafY